MRRSRKPLNLYGFREFESHPHRHSNSITYISIFGSAQKNAQTFARARPFLNGVIHAESVPPAYPSAPKKYPQHDRTHMSCKCMVYVEGKIKRDAPYVKESTGTRSMEEARRIVVCRRGKGELASGRNS